MTTAAILLCLLCAMATVKDGIAAGIAHNRGDFNRSSRFGLKFFCGLLLTITATTIALWRVNS